MIPTNLDVKKTSRCVQFDYPDGSFQLSFEFLRVHSPSAEVRGHGVGNEVLQHGKQDVGLLTIEPTGNYALKFVFDDGHDSGLYDWNYLRHLCTNQDSLWQDYLAKLEQAGKSRQAQQINFKSL